MIKKNCEACFLGTYSHYGKQIITETPKQGCDASHILKKNNTFATIDGRQSEFSICSAELAFKWKMRI
jgi:hypothetical protein